MAKRRGEYEYVAEGRHEFHKRSVPEQREEFGQRRTGLAKKKQGILPAVNPSKTNILLREDPVYAYKRGRPIPEGLDECMEMWDGFHLMFDKKCEKCSELPRDTLMKIAIIMEIPGIDQYTTKDSLCRKIARVLASSYLIENGTKSIYYMIRDILRNEPISMGMEFIFYSMTTADLFFSSLANIDDGRPPQDKSHSLIYHVLMREQFLRRIGKPITLRWLQETEKYVDAFPEFKAIWEQDKEEIWNLVYRNYNGFPVFTAMEQFSRWVAERNMITAILAVKQTHSRLPREMRNMIAYQTLLADCDVDIPNLSDKEVYPSGLSYPRRMIGENAEPDIFAFSGAELLSGTQWINEQFDKLGVKEQKERSYKQHPLVGKWWPSEEKLIYTPPTLKLYGLAELLGVAEFNIMGGWLNNTVPLWSKARYCKVLKERIGLIAPEPVETILEESRWRAQAEEELQKKQLRERQTRQMVEMDQADEEEKRQQTALRRRQRTIKR